VKAYIDKYVKGGVSKLPPGSVAAVGQAIRTAMQSAEFKKFPLQDKARWLIQQHLQHLPLDVKTGLRFGMLRNVYPELEAEVTRQKPEIWEHRPEEKVFIQSGPNTWSLVEPPPGSTGQPKDPNRRLNLEGDDEPPGQPILKFPGRG
jgi:hypothetical protein